MPRRWLEILSGGAVEIDGQRLDPSLAIILRVANRAKLHTLSPPRARRRLAALDASLPKASALMERVEEKTVTTEGLELKIRCYTPADLQVKPPALVYFHGGGWVLGDLESSDNFCRLIAHQTPCKVFSVDYRLAPEHPFPAGLEDAEAAFRWVCSHAEELGVDPRRVAIGGDSAGANLSAVVSAKAKSESAGPRPFAQLLAYPATLPPGERASYELFGVGFGLERVTMDYFFGHYLDGSKSDVDAENPLVSPALADDFSALPPTIVATAGFDLLRDEGDAYAERLGEAGVPVRHLRYPSLGHSFASVSGLAEPRRAIDEMISELAELFRSGD